MSVVSGGDAAEILEAAEHALDCIAIAIESWREAVFPSPIGLGRDVGHCAFRLDLAADCVAVIALVAMKNVAVGQVFQEVRGGSAIGNVAGGNEEGDGPTLDVGQGMDLGGSTTSGAAYGLIFLPPLPPEAERCAFTAELSMRTSAGGPPALASVWNRLTQTPLSAQRTKRL